MLEIELLNNADDTFTSSVRVNKMPPIEERHIQEKALFKFFTSGCSSIECFYFSSYCIGSIVDSNKFPIVSPNDLRIYPQDVADAFGDRFPQDTLCTKLTEIIKADEFKKLYNYRNFLSHRGALPRQSHLGGNRDGLTFIPKNPSDLSDNWIHDFELNEATTRIPREWLENLLQNCIAELNAFTKEYLHAA